jgi:hypothetical protein
VFTPGCAHRWIKIEAHGYWETAAGALATGCRQGLTDGVEVVTVVAWCPGPGDAVAHWGLIRDEHQRGSTRGVCRQRQLGSRRFWLTNRRGHGALSSTSVSMSSDHAAEHGDGGRGGEQLGVQQGNNRAQAPSFIDTLEETEAAYGD